MFAIQPTTQSPDVDQKSRFFEGYNSGWQQMSDAMQRLQKKRALDQQDRQLALSEWQTRVNADINYRQLNHSQRQSVIGQKLNLANMDIESRRLALLEAVAPLDHKLKLAQIQSEVIGAQALDSNVNQASKVDKVLNTPITTMKSRAMGAARDIQKAVSPVAGNTLGSEDYVPRTSFAPAEVSAKTTPLTKFGSWGESDDLDDFQNEDGSYF
jgi:hypothetical protein